MAGAPPRHDTRDAANADHFLCEFAACFATAPAATATATIPSSTISACACPARAASWRKCATLGCAWQAAAIKDDCPDTLFSRLFRERCRGKLRALARCLRLFVARTHGSQSCLCFIIDKLRHDAGVGFVYRKTRTHSRSLYFGTNSSMPHFPLCLSARSDHR